MKFVGHFNGHLKKHDQPLKEYINKLYQEALQVQGLMLEVELHLVKDVLFPFYTSLAKSRVTTMKYLLIISSLYINLEEKTKATQMKKL